MYEKILQKLKEQRGDPSNVSDRTLQDLAKNLEAYITTDDLLKAMDMTTHIISMDGNINFHTADQVKKLEAKRQKNSKKETDLDDSNKKIIEDDSSKKQEEVPVWAKGLMETNKTLANKLDKFEADKTTSTREVTLKKSFKDLPEFYTKPIAAGFKNMSFEDDEAFETYLTDVNSSGEAFKLAAKEQGLNTSKPDVNIKKIDEPTGETNDLADARKIVKEEKEKQEKVS